MSSNQGSLDFVHRNAGITLTNLRCFGRKNIQVVTRYLVKYSLPFIQNNKFKLSIMIQKSTNHFPFQAFTYCLLQLVEELLSCFLIGCAQTKITSLYFLILIFTLGTKLEDFVTTILNYPQHILLSHFLISIYRFSSINNLSHPYLWAMLSSIFSTISMSVSTTIHKIFETNSTFHVKQRTMGKV